ncbi:hypothetical protein NDU88_011469 [Pleurodeles waltl]|uniref:Uncharacterized protein n=1 Tax=Pleurodeles waltl TaxID=8319 RepID=A0AAV7QYP3_PLEWA|nr:hypothetical protein NDU88_011469 [Pleurodeles waltl]
MNQTGIYNMSSGKNVHQAFRILEEASRLDLLVSRSLPALPAQPASHPLTGVAAVFVYCPASVHHADWNKAQKGLVSGHDCREIGRYRLHGKDVLGLRVIGGGIGKEDFGRLGLGAGSLRIEKEACYAAGLVLGPIAAGFVVWLVEHSFVKWAG